MFRNYMAAAVGNLTRNWLYTGVTVLGMAAALAATLLIGLFVRDEFTYDRWIPGHERIYRLAVTLAPPGGRPFDLDTTTADSAAQAQLDFPDVQRVVRVNQTNSVVGRGDHRAVENVFWADPEFFSVFHLPVLAGDPVAGLSQPDGLVITRAFARKYFGVDAPIGQTLLVSGPKAGGAFASAATNDARPMRVAAVLKDLPSNTHLNGEIFASGRAPFSGLALLDQTPSHRADVLAYLQLKPGASPEAVRRGLKAFADRHYVGLGGKASSWRFRLIPLADIHFSPGASTMKMSGDRRADFAVAGIGGLILLIASINFVTIMTARASRRALEVGIRKTAGAARKDLILQFMGEAMIYIVLSTLLALSLVEVAMPSFDAFLQRNIQLYHEDAPIVLGGVLLVTASLGLLTGIYPALVLSAFRPALVLKGNPIAAGGSVWVRQVLVTVQFAILIGLIAVSGTIYRQTTFALNDGLRLQTDQVLNIVAEPCEQAFKEAVGRLPGVKRAACASGLPGVRGKTQVTRPGSGEPSAFNYGAVDVGFFELHGLSPLAGRFFDPAFGQDVLLNRGGGAGADQQPSIVINESGARALGFRSDADAVGKSVNWARFDPSRRAAPPSAQPTQIVGVVPDFTFAGVRAQIDPQLYFVSPADSQMLAVKLDGQDVPDTLAAIDRMWVARYGTPIQRRFESQVIETFYRDIILQGEVAAGCTVLAVVIACLGLFGLAALLAERRTKDIGIRKAMGASTLSMVRLLLWQFTQPVLWANLIAWPLAWWAMDSWLHGFAYRVDLPPWLFLAASAMAALIAWATVGTHAWLVARASPVRALRYE